MSQKQKILSEFKKYAKKGRGKAFLIFKENQQLDFSKAVLDLCLHNYAYDPQCEGERSEYTLQFFRELNQEQKNAVVLSITELLERYKISDDWDFLHFFITAAKISKEGFSKVGDILLKRFEECDDYELLHSFASESIIELLGFEGLAKVAERRGEIFLRDKESSEDDYLFYSVHGLDGEQAKKMLTERAKSNEKIKAFLARIEETTKHREEYQKHRESNKSAFEQVKALVEKNKIVPRKLRKALSDDEVKYFAKKLLEQKTKKNRIGYLSLFAPFWRLIFPDDPRKLLPLFSARKNTWYNDQLVDVLTPFSLPELRKIAENALKSDDYAFFYLDLLKENYREGDGEKIAKKLAKQPKPHDFHHAGITVLDIFEANTTADCLLPLSLIVEASVCGQCRLNAVELLEKAGVLSDELRAEREFDSYKLSLAYGE